MEGPTVEGLNYRARVELTDKAGTVVAAVGETCERVNPESLGWLSDQRLIEPADAVTEITALCDAVPAFVDHAGTPVASVDVDATREDA